MNEAVTNILICGVGGQGTLLTSRILGGLAAIRGYDVKLSEVHGMSQRGGSVVTHCRYGGKVYEPIVEEGRADLVVAFETLEALRHAHFLKPGGVLVVNDHRIPPITVTDGGMAYPENIIEDLSRRHHVAHCDARKIAAGLGNAKAFNTVILGLAARFLAFGKDEWIQVIRRTVPPKTVDVNLAAFGAGYGIEGIAD